MNIVFMGWRLISETITDSINEKARGSDGELVIDSDVDFIYIVPHLFPS